MTTGSFEVTLNGEASEVAVATTLASLLAELGRHPRTVAIEHNGVIVRRDDYAKTILAEGDEVEIVGFVQGG